MEQRFLPTMSPGLVRVAERAREFSGRMLSLAHHLDVEALRRSYLRMRKDAAVGVDGVTWERYGQNLEENLQGLHKRMKTMRYRHQPILRVHIPKGKGKTRPIGISTTEDKIVQGAISELLEAIYEQDFLDCSYGFRRGRKAHDAMRALDRAVGQGAANWILEADVADFFGSLDRPKLKEILQERLADRNLLRLIGKCLHVGVLDGEEFSEPDEGTVQGSCLSPLLGNIYLHHALDRWFEAEVKPRLKGKAALVRFADDFVVGFERRDDAEQVMKVLAERLAEYGLQLHPEKTRLVDYRRPSKSHKGGKGPGSIDFLGFRTYWKRGRSGGWHSTSKTQDPRHRRMISSIYQWCRRHRHLRIKEQHEALTRKIRGHVNYFGVRGNELQLKRLVWAARRSWFRWLNRRSQRSRLTWPRFNDLLKDFPLAEPRPHISLWGTTP